VSDLPSLKLWRAREEPRTEDAKKPKKNQIENHKAF